MISPRFHVSQDLNKADEVFLDKKETKHARAVLRLKEGEIVELFDAQGHTVRGIVAGFENGLMKIALDKNGESPLAISGADPWTEITLAVSVIKPEAMDLLVQKCCELGVFAIQPLITERTVVRLSAERWHSKHERWQKIAIESCKQCGRPKPPSIGRVKLFKDFVPEIRLYDRAIVPTLALQGVPLYNTLTDPPPKRFLALVGPEGDFTAEEARRAISEGAVAVSLGEFVMRSETAAIYLVSSLSFYFREIAHAGQ